MTLPIEILTRPTSFKGGGKKNLYENFSVCHMQGVKGQCRRATRVSFLVLRTCREQAARKRSVSRAPTKGASRGGEQGGEVLKDCMDIYAHAVQGKKSRQGTWICRNQCAFEAFSAR